MSVRTLEPLDRAKFDQTVGGQYTVEGGPFRSAMPKTFTGVGGVTDQAIATAISVAAAFLVAQEEAHTTPADLLRQSYPVLRQWATDAATANTNWPTMTAAQKDAAMRTMIQRLGIFLDRFADLLQTLNADQ